MSKMRNTPFLDDLETRMPDYKNVKLDHVGAQNNRNRVKKAEKFLKEMHAVTKEWEREAGIKNTAIWKSIIALIITLLVFSYFMAG